MTDVPYYLLSYMNFTYKIEILLMHKIYDSNNFKFMWVFNLALHIIQSEYILKILTFSDK